MRRTQTIIFAGCLSLLAIVVHSAQEAGEGEAQRVLDYLREHPGFLLENPDILQRAFALHGARQEQTRTMENRRLIAGQEQALFASVLTPVRGSRSAAYILLEFSDYQCIPCKRSFPEVEAFLAQHNDVRLVHLQLPVYGPLSVMAARAALIAQREGEFEHYHATMMQAPHPVDMDLIDAALAAAGVAAERFRSEMNAPGISGYIQSVREFAAALNVIGTPTFFLAGRIIPGGVDRKILEDHLANLKDD